jgi:hypothetical protein
MTPSQGNNPGTCPKCNSPIASGMKFCESCGAKVEQPPVCGQCGAPLLSNVKFCESCGKPVAAQAAPLVSAVPPTPAPAAADVTPAAKSPAAASAPAEVKKPAPESEPAAAASAKVPDKKIPEKPKETGPKPPGKMPASRTQTMVIAGVVGLVIIVALAYFVLLPMLSGTGTASAGNIGPPSAASPATPAQNAVSASFVPEPTQVPPPTLLVTYEAARDPISGLVTVTFRGGTGQYGVSGVSIRLTRSDGQVLTQSFKPQQIGSFTTMQGTKMTDRIEVIANYYNGDKYRIIDQLFEYKKKF